MLWYFKKCSLLALISVICYTILGYIETKDFNLILLIIYSFFLVAIPNIVFLLLLSWLNKEYKVYFTTPLMVLEVILLCIIGLFVRMVITYIPDQYRFEKTSSYTKIRSCFASPYVEIYQYIILFFVLFLYLKLKANNPILCGELK